MFVQFAIFLVMMAVLYALVFLPFFKVQDERSRRIAGARRDAKAMDERAVAMIADYESRLVKAKQRGAEERIRMRTEGQAREREVLGAARAAGQAQMAEAMTRARAEEEIARRQLASDAQDIARTVAGRVLGRAL